MVEVDGAIHEQSNAALEARAVRVLHVPLESLTRDLNAVVAQITSALESIPPCADR